MAYDTMGNYIADYETDEERRLREEQEAAKATPVTQTIKTNPVTGQQEMTIKGTPRDLSAANPLTPTVTTPVAPSNFARMQQVESNGQDFDAQGRPLTSPAGAMYRNQVMPATAANPGYGVRPASAQTPEEYNRVGEEYYNALLKKYNGNVEMATAAYNAGPGRVDRNVAANQGQLNPQQLPNETQGYLSKVLGAVGQGVNAVMPSAQADTVSAAQLQRAPTITPVTPSQPVTPNQVAAAAPVATPAAPLGGTGLKMPGVAPTVGAPVTAPALQEFMNTQDNPMEMLRYGSREDVPQYLRDRAKTRAYELMDREVKQAEAKKQAEQVLISGNGTAMTRALRDNGDQGNYLKMIMLGFISPELAGKEAIKLGFGNKWTTDQIEMDGKPVTVEIQTRGDGKILGGNIAGSDVPLTPEQLSMIGTGPGKNKPDVSTQDVEKNGQAGRVVTTFDKNNRPTTYVESGGKRYDYDTSWKPRSIATAAAKSETTLVNALRKQYGTDMAKAEAKMIEDAGNFGSATNPMSREQFRSLYSLSPVAAPPAAAPAAAAPAAAVPPMSQAQLAAAQVTPGSGTTVAAPVTPQQVAAAPAPAGTAGPTATAAPIRNAGEPEAAFKQRQKDWTEEQQTLRKGRDEVMKKAGDVIADSSKIVTDLVNVERAANDAVNKKTNFGTITNNLILPGEQYIGQKLKTQDYINTMNVLEQVNKQAAINAKMLGANPTDRDLQFVTATKPDTNWPPEAVADWLRKSADGTRRTLDFARKQMESGGRYIPETPQGSPGTAANPIKL